MELALALLLKYKYFVLFPIAVIEGPILSLVVGFLVYTKVFDIVPAFLIMILGDFIPDSLYYFIGYFGSRKGIIEKYFSKEGKIFSNLKVIENLWNNHGRKTMFLSKIAYGLSTPLLISAGLVKMSYKKFISYAFIVTLFQFGLLTVAGYYLGYSYQIAEKYVKYIGIFFAILLILFIAGYFFMTKYFRKQFIKEEEEEQENEIKTL